ncbi:hypothetical protein BH09PSE2_BH09PSE2_26320 [soil metagenome]
MPTLIRRDASGGFAAAADESPLLPLAAVLADPGLLHGRVGVLLTVADDLAALVPLLPKLSLVALDFAKYRDGRAYTTAVLLRTRHGFTGELRAMGDVLLEEAPQFLRCGFDSFEVADGSMPEEWAAEARAHSQVYQRAADGRAPIFSERSSPLPRSGRGGAATSSP